MMNRRTFILTTAGLLAAPPAAEAQQAAKIARIGYLGGAVDNKPNYDAFLQGLRDLGYVEGRNVVVEYRGAEGKNQRLPALPAGSSPALRGRAAISRGCQASFQIWSASVWNTSRRSLRESAGLLSSGSQVPTPNAWKRSCSLVGEEEG